MKKTTTLILFSFFLVGSILAQNNFSGDPEEGDKGPVIDNINADVKLSSGVDKRSEAGNAYNNRGFDDDGSTVTPDGNNADLNYSDFKMFDGTHKTLDGDELVRQVRERMNIYPVPVTRELTIDLGIEVHARIRLVNIIGQEILNLESTNQEWRIDMIDYPAGTYFLSIEIENDVIVKRIEKNN